MSDNNEKLERLSKMMDEMERERMKRSSSRRVISRRGSDWLTSQASGK